MSASILIRTCIAIGTVAAISFLPGAARADSGYVHPHARAKHHKHHLTHSANANQPPALRSNIAYMVDSRTGETLFDKNSQTVTPIASVTKLMTAMVALDSKASLSEPLQVSDDDRDAEKNTGSRLRVGSSLSREDMIHIALMSSENRAAAALSRYYPGGRPAFIAAMNQKAKALGMQDTHFENPAGLSKLNVSSARDLVKMVKAAYQYPLIRDFSTDPSYQVNTGKGILNYHNTNILLHDPNWNISVQKTGFINESGVCLVMQATIKERAVVMVLLDAVGKHSDFADAGRLRTMLQEHETAPIASLTTHGSIARAMR